jgi:hypothetical protein
MIRVTYSTVDRFRQTRTFKTLAGARRYAQKWVGVNPDQAIGYAISDDGVGKITVLGCALSALFGRDERNVEVTTFTNQYDCPCGTSWEDEWCAACDDDCPSCGTTCSPTESEEGETVTLVINKTICGVCDSTHAF